MDKISFWEIDWVVIGQETYNTMLMLGLSTLFTVLIGLPVGVILYLTSRGQLLEEPITNIVLGFIVNVLRSIPFIILMILIIPITKMIVGTSIGVAGSIPPLVISAAPFFARLVETSLHEVDRGVIEASQSMGASYGQIIWRVLLPEARPSLFAGITITTVALVSYTAMAGVIGGGGLGDLAIRFGYQRFETVVMIVTVVILLILVQILQSLGDRIVRRYQRK